MVTESTVKKLYEMRLGAMAAAFREQLTEIGVQELRFEERFGMLVDAEWTNRKNNRLTRLIRDAGYAFSSACVEDIEYHDDRKLDQTQITRLVTCDYTQKAQNIIILGASGAGKTFLSNAFGVAANRKYLPVKYARLPELLGELAVARAEGTFRKAIKLYKQVKLLILDDWLLFALRESETRDLLEIIEARYNLTSTIICSQFKMVEWHERIGAATIAEAITDRVAHNSHLISIKGKESMRRRMGLLEKVAEA